MLDQQYSKDQILSPDIPRQLDLFDPPSDLAQRMTAIYNRAALRFRQHEDAQHARIVSALQGIAVVQSGTVGGHVLRRVIVAVERREVAA